MEDKIIWFLIIIISMLVGNIIADIIEKYSYKEDKKYIDECIKKDEEIEQRIEDLKKKLKGNKI